MSDEKIFDIALSYDQTITSIEKVLLYKKYQSSEKILSLSINVIKNILGRRWSGKNFDPEELYEKAKKSLPYINKTGTRVIKFCDIDYPETLKCIPDLPFLIFAKGNINLNFDKSIAVIGTRDPDKFGIKRTIDFTSSLVDKGYTIISGLAKGIDTTAHNTAVVKKARTIAVIGCGIDRIYPACNKDLVKKIIENNGAVISEYPPSIKPNKWNFPKRNRIIAGLSKAVLITQSPEKSGTLITANLAVIYNRRLFAAKPDLESYNDSGNKNLIFLGARAVSSAEELLDDLNDIKQG
ncbi:MAG: DNA-processing protein DprA [Spirochaetes bacterium]|nr:DNA-processing protein DprA [Spirochaetota bacterium]